MIASAEPSDAPARATIEMLPEPEEKRVPATGAVASVQEAELSMPATALGRLWQPASLERLARGYWLYLARASRGVIRVLYGEASRTVVVGPSLARTAAVSSPRVRDLGGHRGRYLADRARATGRRTGPR